MTDAMSHPTLSVELVPRSPEDLRAELARAELAVPRLERVNIPDLQRFPLRSWEACQLAGSRVDTAIPHLRALDFAGDGLEAIKGHLAAAGLAEVILVQGEPGDDETSGPPTTTLDAIRALRAALPDLRIWTALDPYRGSPRRELEYAQAKREAGADGFFTQPFFDLRYQEVWADLLADEIVWWGVTPVLTPANRRYWERRNCAFLPADFEATLDWNRATAARAIRWARETDARLYFMPIRVDLVDWLGGAFD